MLCCALDISGGIGAFASWSSGLPWLDVSCGRPAGDWRKLHPSFRLCHGTFAQWISNMSLAATSVTKSVVSGVMPSADFTPGLLPNRLSGGRLGQSHAGRLLAHNSPYSLLIAPKRRGPLHLGLTTKSIVPIELGCGRFRSCFKSATKNQKLHPIQMLARQWTAPG